MSGEEGFINLALLRAAVSGRFDPLALLKEIPADRHDAVIGALSLVCDEEIVNDRFFWTLRAAVRRQQLARLDRPASVHAALDGAPTAEPDDVFATALRRLLLGEDIAIPPAGTAKVDSEAHHTLAAEEAARHSALQFAASAPVVDKIKRTAELNACRGRIAERQQQASIAIVLPDKLYGRNAEVERLLRFATGTMKDTRPMLVTGIAGVGKSAVLAAVLKRQLKRGHAAIQIDFDRPDLSDAGPLPIVREIMRQLELALLGPAKASMQKTATVLSAVRDAIRAFELKQSQRATFASQFSFILSAVYPPLLHDIDESMRAMPVLLVLDTFEIVGSLGADAVNRVLRLEADLREQAGLKGLRTIISGRGVPLAEADSEVDGVNLLGAVNAFGRPTRRITIEGLADADGADLLAARDRNRRFPAESDRQRLSKALKGHPMALLVLERFARERSAAEVNDLVVDIESNSDLSAEFAQAFVYTRVLERLTDPEIRRLAHPGLVLRLITPDLIRLVLAGPCLLGIIDQERAEVLFEKLKSQYWLVETISPGVVRHRPDLRRQMLPGMFAGQRESDLSAVADEKRKVRRATLEVCTNAAAFYRHGPAEDDYCRPWWETLKPQECEVEATYYDALSSFDDNSNCKAPLQISAEFATALRFGLGADFESLPVAWRGVIKAARGDFRELSDAERTSLTGRLREAAESVEIERQLKAGKTSAADKHGSEEVLRRGMSKKLSEAQMLMTKLGIDAGRVDGVAGPRTTAGIMAFKEQQGTEADGEFDDDLLGRLRLAAKAIDKSLLSEVESGDQEKLRPSSSARGGLAGDGDSTWLKGDSAPPMYVPDHSYFRTAGQGSDLVIAEQQVRAAFAQADFVTAGRHAVAVEACFANGMISESSLMQAKAGQVWASGLWQAMLVLRLEGKTFTSNPMTVAMCSEIPLGGLSAAVLVGRLTVPMQPDDHRKLIQRQLLPMCEFRLRSVDGLRHAALLILDTENVIDRVILFDASALALADPKLLKHLAGVASGDQLLAFDFDTEGLRPFAEALAAGTASALDFERVYNSDAMVRWPPRDPELCRRESPIANASFRGLTPEIHEPTARLIEGLTINDAVTLVDVIASKAVHWPTDLWFQPIVETELRSYEFSEIQSPSLQGGADFLVHDRRSYDPRLALTVVQSADRCGVLRFALSELAKRDSRGESLLKLYDIITKSFFLESFK